MLRAFMTVALLGSALAKGITIGLVVGTAGAACARCARRRARRAGEVAETEAEA